MAVDRTKYPKCKYHANLSAVVVADPDEEKALGAGWFDHPDLVSSEEPAKSSPRAEEPKAKISARGAVVPVTDPRW